MIGVEAAGSLPYASSLCGACYDVCPVKINIPEVLVHLRARVVDHKEKAGKLRDRLDPERLGMKVMARIFATPARYEQAQKLARLGQLPFARKGVIEHLPPPLNAWTTMRDLQQVPKQSFRDWWRERADRAPAERRPRPVGETKAPSTKAGNA